VARFCVNDLSPFSSSHSELDPAYDSEAFTLATNDFFEKDSMVLCQGSLWNFHCWVCVIFFARVVVSERLRRARRGVRGGR
jgi:hypothetical protein